MYHIEYGIGVRSTPYLQAFQIAFPAGVLPNGKRSPQTLQSVPPLSNSTSCDLEIFWRKLHLSLKIIFGVVVISEPVARSIDQYLDQRRFQLARHIFPHLARPKQGVEAVAPSAHSQKHTFALPVLYQRHDAMAVSFTRALPLRCLLSPSATLPLLQTARVSTVQRPTAEIDPTKPPTFPRNANFTLPKDEPKPDLAPVRQPTLTPEQMEALPYVIRRTPYSHLPVYRVWKNGGTREKILIKKVNGNKKVLVQELKDNIGVTNDRIKINYTTGHIEIIVGRH